MKNEEQEILALLSNHTSDYTAESIASALLKKGALPEQIILKSNGTSKRSHKKDVTVINTSFNNNAYDLFVLESPREGIYDTLPESLFHSFSGKKTLDNKFQIIEEIKKHREEEKHARDFFLPFEQEFFNIKRILFSFEDEFELFSNASNLIDIYKDHYPILNDLTTQKGYLFIRLLPLIHDIRDDFEKIEECLTMLLDFKVNISSSFKKNTINAYTPPELGFATLGTDTIIGNYIEDGEPDLNITLTPMRHLEIRDFLFFDKPKQLAMQLCNFFIGAQYDISISYEFDIKEDCLINDTSILGYNVYL